jgi:glucosylceramidase
MNKITKTLKNRRCEVIMLVIVMFAFISKIEAQTVTPWMTTGDQTKLLQQQSNVSFGTNSGSNPSTVTINATITYQTMDGFGYTLTEGSCEVISGMAATQQNQLLNDLYNPTTGLNVNVVRISIGASDLSSSSYSYNETSGDFNMNNFSLNGPDATYLIPIIKKILLINPNIKILATPWSPPRWMKTNSSWVGGSLQTQYYAAYAKYFVKYFDAMKAQGISIWGITPQNEPENPNNEPSMSMNSTEQKNFINTQLGPQMATAGYGNIKIIAFDHNCDNTAYAIDVLNNSSYADGAAFHMYAGNASAMSTVHNATNKNVYFTEQYTGNGNNFGGDFGWHIQNVVIGTANNWAKTVLEWNIANNSSLGPHTPGGCTTCLGAVTITNSTSYTKNAAYYIIGQISKFVKAGAIRVATSSTSGSIISTGFKNPDGSIALLVYNSGTSANTIRIASGTSAFDYAVPAASAVTFNWATVTPIAVTGVSVSPTTANIAVNTTSQLVATVAPTNATNKNVTWSSNNTSVATVNSNGLVTGVAQGTAIITVTTISGGKTATSSFTIQGQHPYGGTAITLPGVIQAENYDLGGQNVAYNDNETTNQGGAYRTSEGVDITAVAGTSGFATGWTVNGEWTEYTTNVTAGTYTIEATVATINSGKQLRVLLDGTTLATLSIPNTGSWDTFQTVSVPNITFTGGSNKVLRLEIIGGDFNIDKIEVKSVVAFPGYYNIISRNSNKGLDVADNSTTSGGRIQQYDIVSGGGSNQRWKFVPDGSGNFYIIAKSTQMYLATENNNTADGVKVVQRTLVSSNEFKWTITDLGGGYYKIINLNSGKSLDVENVSDANGANIQVWSYSGGLNEQWQLVQVETTTGKKSLTKEVKEPSEDKTSFYLNSTSDYLKINTANSGPGEVQIYSISGLTLLKKGIDFVKGNEVEVEISILPKGIYIVKINDGKEISSKKILK